MSKHTLNKNIILTKQNNFNPREKKGLSSGNFDGIVLVVNLGDKREYNSLINDYKIKLNKLHTVIDLAKGYHEGLGYAAEKTQIQFVSLMIKKEYLFEILPYNKNSKSIYEFFEKNTSIKNCINTKSNPKTQALAREIIQTPYKNTLDKLYLEAKSLELLHTELNSLLTNDFNNDCHIKFSTQDKEAIYYAREIMMNDISNPPSLKELSYKVKLNQTKLKYGFSKFFNQSPYSISLESRLQEAKKLLEFSEYNITEIAYKVGYQYIQSFSNAYFKRFGIRPKDMMKSRKYYY